VPLNLSEALEVGRALFEAMRTDAADAATLLWGLPRCGSGRRSLLGPPRRAASPAAPRCSIAFRPSGCGPPLQRASPVVLAAHPRLGGALGFWVGLEATDDFDPPTAVFRWTVRISGRAGRILHRRD
ncbi:hypothetical protein KXW38_001503, partial [Aspergillus fumigatus]